MAELGIAASGIAIASIAIQVGDSLLKLKIFWDDVKEAPEEIKWLIEEIEVLSLALSDVESSKAADNLPQPAPASASRCLELCRKGAGILETVAKELDTEIRKRKKAGGFKAVLKKGTIERLKERMRSAQFMLMLSNQAYSEALQKQRHELQRQWAELQQREFVDLRASVSQSTEVVLSLRSPPNHKILQDPNGSSLPLNTQISEREPDSASLEQTVAIVKKAQRRQQSFIATLSTPRWFSITSRALEISGAKAPFGWDFSVRTYNVVPWDAPVMKHARRGEVLQIQKLLTEGGASLCDRTEYGDGIIDMAVMYGRLKVVHFLMSQNVNFLRSGIYTLRNVLDSGPPRDEPANQFFRDVSRLIASQLALDDLSPFQVLRELTSCYWGNSGVLSWIMHQLGYSFKHLTQRERVEYCLNLLACTPLSTRCYPFQPDAARLVWRFFGSPEFDPATCCITNRFGFSLLHGIAGHLNLVVNEKLHKLLAKRVRADNDTDPLDSWVRKRSSELVIILGELLTANSARIHGLAVRTYRSWWHPWCSRPGLQTPLMTVIFGAINGHLKHLKMTIARHREEEQKTIEQAISTLLIWLKELKSVGVDLVDYGHEEQEIHIQKQVSKEWQLSSTRLLRLISFTYGSEPTDWEFWFTEVMENYFLCFWDMVDHPERGMPGAWNEEGNYDDYGDFYDGIYDPEFEEAVTVEDCDIVE